MIHPCHLALLWLPIISLSKAKLVLTNNGATSYMTFKLTNLNLTTPFHEDGTITIASNACLGISHIGSSKLPVPYYAFERRKFYMFLSCHNICYISIGFAKIISAYLCVMTFGFGSRTRSRGESSSIDYEEPVFTLLHFAIHKS